MFDQKLQLKLHWLLTIPTYLFLTNFGIFFTELKIVTLVPDLPSQLHLSTKLDLFYLICQT